MTGRTEGTASSRADDLAALDDADGLGLVRGRGELVVWASAGFGRLVGRAGEPMEGLSWGDLGAPDPVGRDVGAFAEVARGRGAALVKDFARPDGTRVPTLTALVPVASDPGGWLALVMDVSSEERLSHLALSEAAIVSTLLEDAPIGFAFISPDLRFVRINRELAAMNGRSVEEHEGVLVFDLLPQLRDPAEALLRQVLASGEPIRDIELTGETPADPGTTHTWLESFFPVRAGDGPTLGVAAIARDETVVRRLQAQLARTSARQQHALQEVQRTLLPSALPRVDGYELAARYLPAEADVGLGGDWYDAVQTRDGRLVLSVGDVIGHGADAIGLMARASSAIRAYVWEGHGPAVVLTRLNALLRSSDASGLATAAIVSVDLTTGALTYARAGHPYPLVVDAAGEAHACTDGAGMLLGTVDSPTYTTGQARLDAGSALLLYTDGLVERRDERFRDGVARLSASVGTGPRSAEQLVERAERRCLDGQDRRDDACLLALVRRG